MSKPLVVITGATHGVGRALAAAFAAEGNALLLVARHTEPLDGVSAERVQKTAVDVADYEAVEEAIRKAEGLYGPAECLINNAGLVKIGKLETRDVPQMSYEIDVLFKGVLHGIQAVLPGTIARKSAR